MSSDLPTESARDTLLEDLPAPVAEQGADDWVRRVAITAMLLSLLSTVGALMAGLTSTESLKDRTAEILLLSRLQGERLHIVVLRSKDEILREMGKPVDAAEFDRIAGFERDITALAAEIARQEEEVHTDDTKYALFAVGVALLSVAITLSGMAIITTRQFLWQVGMALGAVGSGFVGWGIYQYLGIGLFG